MSVDGVEAHGGKPFRRSGSIPASTLHFWIDAATPEAMDLVEQFHYSQQWPTAVQMVMTAHESGGLFGNRGRAVAAVVYTIPPTRWRHPVWELSRLVRADDVVCHLSELVGASVRAVKKRAETNLLVSFADVQQKHHGGIYQACGWRYAGKRAPASEGVIVDGEFVPGRSANNRFGTRSAAKLIQMGVNAADKRDEGKHLYYKPLNQTGERWAEEMMLRPQKYPKPDRDAA